ncbi:MAG TPA: FG-GAP-like repeat-containing protein [Planctomycetota bacterium]|nr:FG-GAP-like repeat-containing protein [Planctomycetota bacterium]
MRVSCRRSNSELFACPVLTRAASATMALVAMQLAGIAQTVLFEATGATAGDGFGWSVAFLDDLDGDGQDDWIVGSPGDGSGGVDAGMATVFSGTNGTVLHTFHGSQANREFGYAVASGGDSDLDGVGDILVGAPGGGRAKLFSGATGALLLELTGSGEFGAALCSIGDWSGDGRRDIVVGAPGANRVSVHNGVTGVLLATLQGSGRYGHSVADIGDVDSDGVADLACGAPRYFVYLPDMGKVSVYSGATASLLYSLEGHTEGMEFGWSIAGMGDVTGDGRSDVVIGARGHGSLHCWDDGRVDLVSGSNGSLLQRWEGSCDSMLGCSVAPVGDVNQDGVTDVIAGEAMRNRFHIYSAADGDTLLTHADTTNMGWAVTGGGDVNGDGYPDFIATSPGSSVWPPFWSGIGKVQVMTMGCPSDAAYSYCPLMPNSVGAGAVIYHQNSLNISANNLRLVSADLPASQMGLFYYGPNASQIPFGNGNRCVSGGAYRLGVVSTGTGTCSYLVDYTNPPQSSGQITAGSTWFFQFWYRDPSAGGAGYNLSDALRLHFCP